MWRLARVALVAVEEKPVAIRSENTWHVNPTAPPDLLNPVRLAETSGVRSRQRIPFAGNPLAA
jgi:hypothetical protein